MQAVTFGEALARQSARSPPACVQALKLGMPTLCMQLRNAESLGEPTGAPLVGLLQNRISRIHRPSLGPPMQVPPFGQSARVIEAKVPSMDARNRRTAETPNNSLVIG
jgi:hypothetical protein